MGLQVYSSLPDGEFRVSVKATDAAGNSAAAVVREWTVDVSQYAQITAISTTDSSVEFEAFSTGDSTPALISTILLLHIHPAGPPETGIFLVFRDEAGGVFSSLYIMTLTLNIRTLNSTGNDQHANSAFRTSVLHVAREMSLPLYTLLQWRW